MDLMWFLFLAHLVGDYALQTDAMAAGKGRSHRLLTLHVTVYTACIALTLTLFAMAFGAFASTIGSIVIMLVGIFVLHWIQDLVKCRYLAASRQAYYADQVLHLAQLYVLRLLLI